MKRNVFIIIFLGTVLNLQAQVKWDGEGLDGNWATLSNWVGDIAPTPTDEVILDNNFVLGDYTVSLPAGNVGTTVSRLIITPSSGATIILINPPTNTSQNAFVANGVGDAITLEAGAVFRNSSGAASGTPISVGASGFFRINNGARYIHNTERGHTTELVSRLSSVPGTEDGIFEFDVPSTAAYTISASGRTYGHLIFSATAAGGMKTYTATGISPFTINGDLEINASSVLSYGSVTNSIIVKKTCTVKPGGVFNISNGLNNSIVSLKGNLDNRGLITETGSASSSRIEFSGTMSQEFASTGNITQSVIIQINNQAGVDMRSSAVLPYQLVLINGKLRTSNTNLLILADNAISTGGSVNSFIEGPLQKMGDDDFDFPIGQGAIFSPIGIRGAGAVSDAFKAEYKRANPQSTPGLGSSMEAGMDHISYVEYWTMERVSGTSAKNLRVYYSPMSFVKLIAGLLVASFETGQWKNKGMADMVVGPASPPYVTGNFLSASLIGEFTAVTLATTDDEPLNPLPVEFVDFTATLDGNDDIIFRWEVGEDCKLGDSFHLEESIDAVNFKELKSVAAEVNRTRYQCIGTRKADSEVYYRVKLKGVDRSESRSNVRRVYSPNDQAESTMICYHSGTELRLKINSATGREAEVMIYDLQGKIIRRGRHQLLDGQNLVAFQTGKLQKGNYVVVVADATSNWILRGKFIVID